MPATTTPAKRGNAIWWVALGGIIAAFAGAVVALNLTVYSASGFVGTYLAALEAKNTDAALATPGVTTIPGVSEALLQRDALGDLADIELIEAFADGRDTVVRFSYTLDGLPDETVFRVTHAGMRLGLFNSWEVADSPVSELPRVDPRQRREVHGERHPSQHERTQRGGHVAGSHTGRAAAHPRQRLPHGRHHHPARHGASDEQLGGRRGAGQ